MKVVIDTNVVVSALFFGGKPRTLIELLINKELDAYITQDIIEEYRDTVAYLQNKYKEKQVFVPLAHIISSCKLIKKETDIKVCRDPDDDKFISCAIDAKCLYIISGDKDLLTIRQYEGIRIMTVAEFFQMLWDNFSP